MKTVAVVFIILSIIGMKHKKRKTIKKDYKRYEKETIQNYDFRQDMLFAKINEFIKSRNKTVNSESANFITENILYYSNVYNVSPILITSLIAVESSFNANAISKNGAKGLGQLMPQALVELGIKDPFDIKDNIKGTIRYLKSRIDMWEGNNNKTELALASYLVGIEEVKKYGGVPPDAYNYIKKINDCMNQLK